MSTTGRHTTRRRHGDRGAAMVEFAIVAVLLLTLMLGVVSFGMLLSTKNSVTQSANEGARSAVAVFARDGAAYTALQATAPAKAKADAEQAAINRMRERLDHLENDLDGPIETECSDAAQCPDITDNPAIVYLARVHDCTITDEALLENLAAEVDTEETPDCIFTRVTYNHAEYRILPTLPLIDAILPETLTDRADIALN